MTAVIVWLGKKTGSKSIRLAQECADILGGAFTRFKIGFTGGFTRFKIVTKRGFKELAPSKSVRQAKPHADVLGECGLDKEYIITQPHKWLKRAKSSVRQTQRKSVQKFLGIVGLQG